jgi:hypothetical protein
MDMRPPRSPHDVSAFLLAARMPFRRSGLPRIAQTTWRLAKEPRPARRENRATRLANGPGPTPPKPAAVPYLAPVLRLPLLIPTVQCRHRWMSTSLMISRARDVKNVTLGNVSHFQATTGQPVPASVKVQKLNPTAQVIFDNKLMLDHTGEEKTAVRFRLDVEGKVVDVHQRSKSLLETFRNVRANGADLDPKTRVRMLRRE